MTTLDVVHERTFTRGEVSEARFDLKVALHVDHHPGGPPGLYLVTKHD